MGNVPTAEPTIDASTVSGTIIFEGIEFERCWPDSATWTSPKPPNGASETRYRIKSLSFKVSNDFVKNFYYHDLFLNIKNASNAYNVHNLLGFKPFETSMISKVRFTRYPSGSSHSFHSLWAGDVKPNDTISYRCAKIPINIESDSQPLEQLMHDKLSFFNMFEPLSYFLPAAQLVMPRDNISNNNNINNKDLDDAKSQNEDLLGGPGAAEDIHFEQKEGVPDVPEGPQGADKPQIGNNMNNDAKINNINNNLRVGGEECIEFVMELTKMEWKRFKDADTKWTVININIPLKAIQKAIENATVAAEPVVRVLPSPAERRQEKKAAKRLRKLERKITAGSASASVEFVPDVPYVTCPLCGKTGIERELFKLHINQECPEAS